MLIPRESSCSGELPRTPSIFDLIRLSRCYGIGPKYAQKFAENGAKGLEDLLAEMDKPEEKRRWKLTNAQTLGVKFAVSFCTSSFDV